MALRVKEIEVGGQKFRIGNLQLKALGAYRQGLAAITAKRPGALHPDDLTFDVVLTSLQRAGDPTTREQIEALDFDTDDLMQLWREVMAWTRSPDAKPEDIGKEPANPPAPSP